MSTKMLAASMLLTEELIGQPFSGKTLRVEKLDESQVEAWDRFVFKQPNGSPFHLNAWRKTIEETFGYRSLYLIAMEGLQIHGVLPLFVIQNPLIGKVLLSVPFAVYGGVLADTPEAQQLLGEEVIRLGESLGVQYVELRNGHTEQSLGFHRVSRYVTFTQEIMPNEERILESIPRKTRYMVRKSLKQGFETRILNGRSIAFEHLYARNLRKLGTPSFPSKFFSRIIENFGKAADIREVIWQGKVASAVLTLFFRDQALPYYGASDPAFHAIAPNNFMYYDLMRWSGANGCRKFDFGRSKKNTGGSYDFKAHWGMWEKELPYEILLVRRKSLPNFTPANPAFRSPRKLWQKLPLMLTRRIGPIFVRLVP